MTTTLPIFAYGSNLCVERLRERVPRATPVATGFVASRKFAYRKLGLDGSGKADAAYTGCAEDRIWGAIYEIDLSEKPFLDECESLGIGYDLTRVVVSHECGSMREAWLYEARPLVIRDRLKPFCWYHELVVHGARQHGLPIDYVAELERLEFVVDADESRGAKHRQLIATTAPQPSPGNAKLGTATCVDPHRSSASQV